MMRAPVCGGSGSIEREMRAQILAILEELCCDMTLHDVREWYFDAMLDAAPAGLAFRRD
jgi:hypothetical protein